MEGKQQSYYRYPPVSSSLPLIAGRKGATYSSENIVISSNKQVNNNSSSRSISSRITVIPDGKLLFTSPARGQVFDSGEVIIPKARSFTNNNIPSIPLTSSTIIPPPPSGTSSKSQILTSNIKYEDPPPLIGKSNKRPYSTLQAPIYAGDDIQITRFIGEHEETLTVSKDELQDLVNNIIKQFQEQEELRADNVMKFLGEVAASCGKKDVKEFYKQPKEILAEIPDGVAYLQSVIENQIKHTYKPKVDKPLVVDEEQSIEHVYRIKTPDKFNLAVQAALYPARLGRVIIKEYYMGHFRIAFEELKSFNLSMTPIKKVGKIMNSSNTALRSFFGKLCGIDIRLEDVRSGQVRQYNNSEERLLLDRQAVIERLKKFKYDQNSDSFIDMTNYFSSNNTSNIFSPNTSSRGPAYSLSDNIQFHF